MLYRNLLMASGILLIVFGVVIYFNATLMQDAAGDFSVGGIRLCLFLASLFLVTAGVSAILTATFRYSKMLLFTNLIGMKLVMFSLLLFVGLVFSSSSAVFAPFWEALDKTIASILFIKEPSNIAAKIPLICVATLAGVVWLFHLGVMISENGGRVNKIIVTRIITFLLFVAAFLPVRSLLEKYAVPLGKIDVPANITVFPLAAFVAWFIVIFMVTRNRAGHSIAKLIALTVLCMILCAGYYYGATALYNSKIGFIFEWKWFPLALFGLALLCVGYNGNHHHQIIGISYCKRCKKAINGWHDYCSAACQNAGNLRAAIDIVEKGGTIEFDDENNIAFDED